MRSIINVMSAVHSNSRHLILFLAAASLIAGCTMQTTAVLYNGTDKPVFVKLFRGTDEVSQVEIALRKLEIGRAHV